MSNVLISTRESFGKELASVEDKNLVVLDADLCTSTKTSYFRDKHPDRFIENGIAEADMICTASGLASCGKKVVISTFATFLTGRYDQIRMSIAYPKANVKLCGSHSGITAGEDGASHQIIEDINLMRGLPNMTVLAPSDDISTRALLREMLKYDGPVYLRLSRCATPIIYTEDAEFEIGKSSQIGEGKDGTIFSYGDVLYDALKAQEILKDENIDVRVIDMYSIKPIDREMVVKSAKETGLLFTLEDHNIIGGLGSAVAEILCEECPKKLYRIGINDQFGISGKADTLKKKFGIDYDSVAEYVKSKFIFD